MIKIICDACGKDGARKKFEYLCHLEDTDPAHGYVDSEGNSTSGRTISADLCNKCYNDIASRAVSRLHELQNKNTRAKNAKAY